MLDPLTTGIPSVIESTTGETGDTTAASGPTDTRAESRTRTEINRENATKSTGPRTPEGKAIASANSFKHGLCAQTMILPADEMQAFINYSHNLATDLRVEGQLEMSLAQNMADAQFQIERANAIENNILQLGALEHTDVSDPTRNFGLDHTTGLVITLKENIKTIDLISRYAARHNRAFLQNHARLREVQKDRLQQAAATPTNQANTNNPGFVPQPGSTGLQACENPPLRTNRSPQGAPNNAPDAKTTQEIAIETIRKNRKKVA